jgi:hypothetical protein
MQSIHFAPNPLSTAAPPVSSDQFLVTYSAPVRNAKRNASPTELIKEDASGDSDQSKRPGAKRRHTEDVNERPMRAGGLVLPLRATPSTHSTSCHHLTR